MTAITKIATRLVLVVALLALTVIAVFASGAIGTTYAQFSSGGGFNLRIDSQAIYNGAAMPAATWALKDLTPGADKFFNFADIKPGDQGRTTLSLHVNQNAWACLQFQNLTNAENGRNEPELTAGDSTPSVGELAAGTEFFAWRDDGDNLFEVGEVPLFGTSTQAASSVLDNTKYAIADALSGGALVASTTRYVGVLWCAGDLSVNTATAAVSCNGEALGNTAQTDSFSVDVSITASTASDQPTFTCNGTPPPPPPPPSGGGLGEQIGLFVKCEIIANYGWPLPTYRTECPNGFGRNNTTTVQTQTISAPQPSTNTGRSERAPRTR
jgi:hypothetical protein